MVQRQFGQYGHVVILVQADAPHRPVPFGVFNSHEEAEEWAETELTLHEGDTYYINYVRDVAPLDGDDGPLEDYDEEVFQARVDELRKRLRLRRVDLPHGF